MTAFSAGLSYHYKLDKTRFSKKSQRKKCKFKSKINYSKFKEIFIRVID